MRSWVVAIVWVATGAVVLCGCRHGRLDGAKADPSEWTQSLDAEWTQRASGFDVSADTLTRGMPHDIRIHPEVRWRVMRHQLAAAEVQVDPVAKIGRYAAAREEGIACLDGAPSFSKRRAEWGWSEALQHIPPKRRLCASWLAIAWTRWADAFGEDAAAVDLARIEGILDALDSEAGRAVAFNRDRARALLMSLPDTATDTSRREGRELFSQLIRATSGERKLALRADFYALHAVTEESGRWCELRSRLLSAETRTPDAKAAITSALKRGDGGLECPTD